MVVEYKKFILVGKKRLPATELDEYRSKPHGSLGLSDPKQKGGASEE